MFLYLLFHYFYYQAIERAIYLWKVNRFLFYFLAISFSSFLFGSRGVHEKNVYCYFFCFFFAIIVLFTYFIFERIKIAFLKKMR